MPSNFTLEEMLEEYRREVQGSLETEKTEKFSPSFSRQTVRISTKTDDRRELNYIRHFEPRTNSLHLVRNGKPEVFIFPFLTPRTTFWLFQQKTGEYDLQERLGKRELSELRGIVHTNENGEVVDFRHQ